MTKRPHENLELIKRVLDKDYLELNIEKVVVEDDLDTTTKASVHTHDTHGNAHVVSGSGAGLVAALWDGFLERYAVEYQSLKSLELATFNVTAKTDTKNNSDGTDAIAVVDLEVRNSDGKRFAFSDSSRSMVSSTVRAVVAAVEYFVNAERAFITLHKCRQDAKERSRDDLVTRYTRELAEVVKSTSYAELIDSIKKELQ